MIFLKKKQKITQYGVNKYRIILKQPRTQHHYYFTKLTTLRSFQLSSMNEIMNSKFKDREMQNTCNIMYVSNNITQIMFTVLSSK